MQHPVSDIDRSKHHITDRPPALRRDAGNAGQRLVIVAERGTVAPHRQQDAHIGAELLGTHVDRVGNQGRSGDRENG